MRELLLRITCDACGDPLDEDKANMVEFKTNGGPAYEVDFCPGCYTTAGFGNARLVKVTKAEKNLTCDVCGFVGKNANGLSAHKGRMHP